MIDFMKTESLGVMFAQPYISGFFRIDHRGRTEVEPLYNIFRESIWNARPPTTGNLPNCL
jgi:hypothetical protein